MEQPRADPPEPPSDGALAAWVAAWHNRHPLAVRITPAQVQGMGLVALPFIAGDGAAAQAKPAFSDNFIPPITRRQVATFALRHGLKDKPDITPLREVTADGDGDAATLTLYLHTAAVEAGGQRLRVLVGAAGGSPSGTARPALLGPRLWSLRRTLVAAALAGATCSALVAVLVVALWLSQRAPAGPVLAAAPPASSAASSAASSPAASAPLPASAASAAVMAAAPAADVAASAPSDHGHPAVGVAEAPAEAQAPPPADIRPRLSDDQRAEARRQGQRLRGEAAAPAAAAASASPPAAADGRGFALVTRTTRGRAASEVMLSLMASAAASATWPGQPRTEVMQVQQGWRAVWWPFASPADAELARNALAAYGIQAEIVTF